MTEKKEGKIINRMMRKESGACAELEPKDFKKSDSSREQPDSVFNPSSSMQEKGYDLMKVEPLDADYEIDSKH